MTDERLAELVSWVRFWHNGYGQMTNLETQALGYISELLAEVDRLRGDRRKLGYAAWLASRHDNAEDGGPSMMSIVNVAEQAVRETRYTND
uniref:Uncharacterized protein n=1 Tax=viral metagenome TaxID=1070528 RepID=A0A6M3JEP4_9ZZZZ